MPLPRLETLSMAGADGISSRVLRLFPMYWVAHLIYLVSPFEARYDPIDYRFILSFLGDRMYPVQMIEYLTPAWWYFGLILELYLIFPLLFRLLQKAGVQWFLVICAAETVLCRYILLFNIFQTDGMVLSAFCGSRLWEFAFGMVVGSTGKTVSGSTTIYSARARW
jgi:peptidoglycan/LPS O-acetylase OafA/YrhL